MLINDIQLIKFSKIISPHKSIQFYASQQFVYPHLQTPIPKKKKNWLVAKYSKHSTTNLLYQN